MGKGGEGNGREKKGEKRKQYMYGKNCNVLRAHFEDIILSKVKATVVRLVS